MPPFAFTTTKWALKLASSLIKADVRIHNLEVVQPNMAIIFVVNHFTRVETLLLPYELHKRTGLEVWSLASGDLFVGRLGGYLRTMGTVSTKDPDRDKVIVHSLLKGNHPWVIFPEGQMIKDKKVVDPAGTFSVYNRGERRPPHKGAAAMALRAEFYRHALECMANNPKQQGLSEHLEYFGLDSVEDALGKRTYIIPVNMTYFPIRARDNAMVRMARSFVKGDLSERAIEELSVEGTILSEDTDIDITLGQPIDMYEYLNRPEYAELMACGNDTAKFEADPKALFQDAADQIMVRYMKEIYRLTRINYDHIFATLIRYQGPKPFTERRYRNRIFLAVHDILKRGKYRLHSLLESTYRDIIYEDPSPKFHDFMELAIREKVIRRVGNEYVKVTGRKQGEGEFHTIRTSETTWVIANELEPLPGVPELIKEIATASREDLSKRIRKIFYEEDFDLFEKDYAEFHSEESHPMDVGRPFLMVPDNYKAGIVLVHGYTAAPLEVRALGEFLFKLGYAVYGVRLKGHGTAPEDLATTSWMEWYESVNRGYGVIKSLTDRIILGGFSTGGCLALYGAGLKRDKIQAVFAINAPLHLQRIAAKLAPTIVTMNTLLKRFKAGREGWDFVVGNPENPHINYKRNPLAGVRELGRAMEAMEEVLPEIVVPTLIVQGSNDPTVHPDSGPDIFEKVGTRHKELTVFERDNHGIVNGKGAEEVYRRVEKFLVWAKDQEPDLDIAAVHAVKPKLPDVRRMPLPETATDTPV